jgi:hypothetical protein
MWMSILLKIYPNNNNNNNNNNNSRYFEDFDSKI